MTRRLVSRSVGRPLGERLADEWGIRCMWEGSRELPPGWGRIWGRERRSLCPRRNDIDRRHGRALGVLGAEGRGRGAVSHGAPRGAWGWEIDERASPALLELAMWGVLQPAGGRSLVLVDATSRQGARLPSSNCCTGPTGPRSASGPPPNAWRYRRVRAAQWPALLDASRPLSHGGCLDREATDRRSARGVRQAGGPPSRRRPSARR